jgi:hypothetical protein
MVPQANPAEFPQQHRTGFPACQAPGLVRSKDHELPVRGESQRATISPAALQLAVFTDRGRRPYDAGSQSNPQVCWQLEDDKNAGNTEH